MPPAVVEPSEEPLMSVRPQLGSFGGPSWSAAIIRAEIRGLPEGEATASVLSVASMLRSGTQSLPPLRSRCRQQLKDVKVGGKRHLGR